MIGDQILENFVAIFSKENELENLTPEKRFEHFANYAVLSRLYSGTVQFDALDTEAAFGIDGVAIIANNVLVTTREEVKDVAKHSLEVNFVFVQAKTSHSFDAGDILKFIQAVDDFFEASPKIPPNDRMKELRDLRASVFEQSIKMDVPPTCELYYVCAGSWQNDQVLTNLVEKERSNLASKHGFANVKFVPVDLDKIKGYYRSIKQRVVKQIEFTKRVVIPKVSGVNQAYIGVLAAKDYLKLITDADGNLERGLFYENVRDFLGDNPVNLEIASAIRQSSEGQDRFVLLNNGVTIVAKSITPVGDDFTLRDYQIVNGCQTSHVLYYNQDSITNQLFVPVKLIATDSLELTNLVIKATNWQTEVKQEAFFALAPFQKKLEEFYGSITNPDHRLFYERRSKQYEADDTPKFRVVSLTMQTKCFVAMFLNEPHSTHRYYGELLKAYQKSIFQESHDPEPYYLSAYAMFMIDRAFRTGDLPLADKRFRYHFLYLLRLYALQDEKISIENNAKKTRQLCDRLRSILGNPTSISTFFGEARRTLRAVLENAHGKYQGEPERRSEFTSESRAELTRKLNPIEYPQIDDQKVSIKPVLAKKARDKGIVKRVGFEFGFITDDRGRDVYFHRSQWNGSVKLSVGTKVSFEIAMGHKGPRAISVEGHE